LAANARFCKHCGAPQPQWLAQADRGIGTQGSWRESSEGGPRLAALRRAMPGPLAEKFLSTRGHIEGERKQVTVLFTDIVDSTALAERLDPEQWATIVNGAHRLVTDRVYLYEGMVAQLLGDGVLCFFGAPVSHEDDPERAVRASLAIISGVQEYATELARRYGVKDLRLRIGLNTGLVIVGNVGSSLHLEYLAIGETVNLAARMQTEAKPNTALMTENTFRLVSTLFYFESRGEVVVKGKSTPVRAYTLLGERLGAPKKRGVTGLTSPMVGRDREFATLKRLTEELREGKGTVVNVLGEAGLGKSRLLAEWRQWVLEDGGPMIESGVQKVRAGSPSETSFEPPLRSVRWAEGRCLSYGVTVAYHLVVDLTRSLLDVPSNLPSDQVRIALQRRLEELFVRESALYEEGYPYLAHLLSLPLDPDQAESLQYMSPQALQGQYAAVIRRAFRSLAQEAPTILVCEDMHWADASSVELLGRLLPLVGDLPLLVCLVSRLDYESPGWRLIRDARETPGVGAIEIHLATLSDSDSQKLVSNLTEEELPTHIRELILSKAEGNPFFVEEVIGMLIDRGAIERRAGGWVAAQDIQRIEIPETILGVLMARVDQLPEDVRRTLQVASVIGREFSLEVLTNVLNRQALRAAPE
jgi:class 3 adenylate cyclase